MKLQVRDAHLGVESFGVIVFCCCFVRRFVCMPEWSRYAPYSSRKVSI